MQVLWMVVGAFLFATMGVCIKYAAVYFNTAEIVFDRGLIGMLALWALSSSQGISLKTRHPWMHAWRSLVGVSALGSWFYAISEMPLASAMTLN
ncbi:MAG: EamA/RhaT family transporter, partial [Comamonadaceae bacterium]|nr:EamA/RhaT family transporter [Comamonadaceae bacterium]